MRIPDPIELGEDSAERWADENVKGDYFTCACGRRTLLEDGAPISANPYAAPVCPTCVDEYMTQRKGNPNGTT